MARRVSRSTTREDLGSNASPCKLNEVSMEALAPALLAAKPERVRELVANNDHDELVSIALIQQNKHVVREGGGIASIVNMLPSGSAMPGDDENSHSGAAEEAPVFRSLAAPTAPAHHAISATTTSLPSAELSLTTNTVVSALWTLAAHSTANQDAIREAGGVPRLVAQLRYPGRPDAPELAGHTAGALWSLASSNPKNQHAVREAGGVAALIDLLCYANEQNTKRTDFPQG